MKKINLKQFKGGPINLLFLLGILLIGIWALTKLTDYTRTTQRITLSAFLKKVELGAVKEIQVMGDQVYGKYRDNQTRFETNIHQHDTKVWDILRKNNVDVDVISPTSSDFSLWHLLLLLSFVMTPLVIWYFLRQSRNTGGNGGNIFSMSKSKAKMFMPSQIKVNFNSVAGAVEAKEDLQDIVDFLKNPDKYKRMGAKLTRGILLIGEPGNGKTLLARAVAGEANCPFFSISGSDFIEVFVGVGAARVRDLFAQARRHAPSIIFIDEIDAVGRHRGSGLGGGHDEREQTLNQLLTEMDGFDTSNASVIVLAATNRSDVIDKALMRPGRFDRQVHVPYPDLISREEILQVHAQGVKIDSDVDLKQLARGTPGFSGAQLANLINEAAIVASRRGQERVSIYDLDEARDKTMLGKKHKRMMLSEKERNILAHHEAGHTLVLLLTPETTDPLYKVTIVPQGDSLGTTHWLPLRDKHTESKEEMLAIIMVALGGRAAEELIFNTLESGAVSDFHMATTIARKMVCFYGMASSLGTVIYQQTNGGFEYSQETAHLIDREVRSIIEACYEQTKKLITDNIDKLKLIAQKLLEKDTLFAGELYELLSLPPREDHKLC